MSLEIIPLGIDENTVPPRIMDFLRRADERVSGFIESRIEDPIPAFVPCDPVKVAAAFMAIERLRLAPGRQFCEWGSGSGVVTCLAAMMGYSAIGIEIEAELVGLARGFAKEFALPVSFFEGNFIPIGAESLPDPDGALSWLDPGGPDGHDEAGLGIDDFDVIFAYPWPGEEPVIEGVFDRHAAAGALLLTYRGVEDVLLQRKVADDAPRVRGRRSASSAR